VTEKNSSTLSGQYYVTETALGDLAFVTGIISCLNTACRQPTVSFSINKRGTKYSEHVAAEAIRVWSLLPESSAKPQPVFIPKAIRDDYTEACRIRDLSPKASATLARRCLQGMIRDFCKIAKARLIDEIVELRKQLDAHTAPHGVTHESVDAIDAVRSVGNIGAHMEKDVDLIVDIEPGEAQILIDLIEMLFEEWYVERDRRAKRLKEITALSQDKADALKIAKQANSKPTPKP
jgi:hypothetical protein